MRLGCARQGVDRYSKTGVAAASPFRLHPRATSAPIFFIIGGPPFGAIRASVDRRSDTRHSTDVWRGSLRGWPTNLLTAKPSLC